MKRQFLFLSLLIGGSTVFAQDSTKINADIPAVSIPQTSPATKQSTDTTIKTHETPVSTPTSSSQKEFTGVAVSPSTLRFGVKPGGTAIKEVKVTNDTKKLMKFKLGFSDFSMGVNGKPSSLKPEENRYGLSRWVSVSPSYFEVKPGQVQKVSVTLSVPEGDSANIAAWTILTIDQIPEDRAPLDAQGNDKTIAMGIIPSFGFGVYIYQNPPNVKVNNVDILKFSVKEPAEKDTTGIRKLFMEVKNVGDGIGFCTSYVELTNTSTGKQERLPPQRFTILPGFSREFYFKLPANLPKGKYSAAGVLDFGSKEEIKAAELDFSVPAK